MKIAIVAAMDKEVRLLLELMPHHSVREAEGQTIYEGRIGRHDVVLSKCGIGKVNSALRTNRLIHLCQPDLVINSGVAGGADASVRIGTVLAADSAGYHDVWCGPGTEPGEADGFPRLFLPYPKGMEIVARLSEQIPELMTGMIATGDRFITTPEEIRAIKEVYPQARACDMESASIAHACAANGVPFMVVRVVSDTPGSGENISQYENFFSEAPEKTFHLLTELLERL